MLLVAWEDSWVGTCDKWLPSTTRCPTSVRNRELSWSNDSRDVLALKVCTGWPVRNMNYDPYWFMALLFQNVRSVEHNRWRHSHCHCHHSIHYSAISHCGKGQVSKSAEENLITVSFRGRTVSGTSTASPLKYLVSKLTSRRLIWTHWYPVRCLIGFLVLPLEFWMARLATDATLINWSLCGGMIRRPRVPVSLL